MNYLMFIGSCIMIIVCIIVGIMCIKDKKKITDPYMILIIITFLIALRTIIKLLGLS